MVTRKLLYSFHGTKFPWFFFYVPWSLILLSALEERIASSSLYWQASRERCVHKSVQLGILKLSQNFSVDGTQPLHTSCSVLGYSKICMPSLDPIKPDWMMTAFFFFFKFSLEKCPEVLKCVCFLPVLQKWVGFQCVLSSHLQRLILTVICICKDLAIGVGVRYVEHWVCLWASR